MLSGVERSSGPDARSPRPPSGKLCIIQLTRNMQMKTLQATRPRAAKVQPKSKESGGRREAKESREEGRVLSSAAAAFNAAYKLDNSPMELRKNISNYFRAAQSAWQRAPCSCFRCCSQLAAPSHFCVRSSCCSALLLVGLLLCDTA